MIRINVRHAGEVQSSGAREAAGGFRNQANDVACGATADRDGECDLSARTLRRNHWSIRLHSRTKVEDACWLQPCPGIHQSLIGTDLIHSRNGDDHRPVARGDAMGVVHSDHIRISNGESCDWVCPCAGLPWLDQARSITFSERRAAPEGDANHVVEWDNVVSAIRVCPVVGPRSEYIQSGGHGERR